MARPIVVSGADKHFFAMGCLLMQSLAQWAPDLPFYFLDFGLDEAQRRFLRERKVLIERPASVPENLHPIVCKTAIGEYLRGIEWPAVLWLDSDMLVVGPLQDRLAEVLQRNGGNTKRGCRLLGRNNQPIVRRRLAHGAVC